MPLPQKTQQFIRSTFPALYHKNYRYFWLGQCVSVFGTWMQRTALLWFVYTLTKSSMLVGMLGVAQFTPMLLFSLFAGVWIDRVSKRKLIIASQIGLMLQAFVMSALAFSGIIQYWHILVLCFIMGIGNCIDFPARQSFFIDLVGKEHLINAIALNSSIVNVARILGPIFAGIVMEFFGPAWCFFFNGLSFIAVIVGVWLIDNHGNPNKNKKQSTLTEIANGFQHIKSRVLLWSTLLLMLAFCTFATNNDVIAPAFVRNNLQASAREFSVLMAAMGGGALIATLVMARKQSIKSSQQILVYSVTAVSVFLMSMQLTNNFLLCFIILACIGFINMVFFTIANSVLQFNTDNKYRGRVMSVFSLVNTGSTPIGNFFAGSITETFGAGMGFFACGVGTIISATAVLLFKKSVDKNTPHINTDNTFT